MKNESQQTPVVKPGYFLYPGHIYFSRTPAVISTVVGACVSVCLWDRRLRRGGMNHFVYPAARDATRATAQYGNAATSQLVRIMFEAGSRRSDLVAQIFGGGAPEGLDHYPTGEQNVAAARRTLERHAIKIASQDVGGMLGRKIVFDVESGHVLVLKVHEIRKEDWLLPVRDTSAKTGMR